MQRALAAVHDGRVMRAEDSLRFCIHLIGRPLINQASGIALRGERYASEVAPSSSEPVFRGGDESKIAKCVFGCWPF